MWMSVKRWLRKNKNNSNTITGALFHCFEMVFEVENKYGFGRQLSHTLCLIDRFIDLNVCRAVKWKERK